MKFQASVVLLSDFGLVDTYVSVLKGVLKTINPSLDIIDLTHDIPPQNIVAANYCLAAALPYFPDGTIYLAIVDPGVGSSRKPLAIKFKRGYLICPDNGLFSGLFKNYCIEQIRELDNPKYWRVNNPSQTFHGRDIFAPVAGYLSRGIDFADLGRLLSADDLTYLPSSTYQIQGKTIIGSIQYIDHFGNLISNIPSEILAERQWSVSIKGKEIAYRQNYSQVKKGETIALINSEKYLEIAINQGNAQKTLQVDYGETVIVY